MPAAIICHGSFKDLEYHRNIVNRCDLVICADGGAYSAKRMGIVPDLIIGDLDSCDQQILDHFAGVDIVKYPVQKEKTDSELAVDYAIQRNRKHIILLGSTGTRLDHTIANLGLLKLMADKGVKGELIDDFNTATVVKKRTRIEGRGCYISLIALWGDVSGITLKGFEYPLNDYTLRMGSTRGISNLLVQRRGEIEVGEGMLLVIKARE